MVNRILVFRWKHLSLNFYDCIFETVSYEMEYSRQFHVREVCLGWYSFSGTRNGVSSKQIFLFELQIFVTLLLA